MKEEEPVIIRMNIAHYRAMLKLDWNRELHPVLERLLAGAEADLVLATNLKALQQRQD